MSVRRCPSCEQLTGYLQGSIGESEAEACESHLANCPTCQDVVHQLDQKQDAFLSMLRRPLTDPYEAEVGRFRALAALEVLEARTLELVDQERVPAVQLERPCVDARQGALTLAVQPGVDDA